MHQRPTYKTFDTQVRQVADLTPRMRRVTLHGHGLTELDSDRPGQWVKLWLDDGPHGRAFTIRRWDPKARELDIDFVRHHGGLAGAWIEQAEPGLPVRLAGPRSDFRHSQDRFLYLLGDETAIPAISAILERMSPAGRALAVVEVEDNSAPQTVVTSGEVEWTWLVNMNRPPGELLSAYAASLQPDPEMSQVWVGCEARAARELRAQFLRLGFEKRCLHASGYWKSGEREHVDLESDY